MKNIVLRKFSNNYVAPKSAFEKKSFILNTINGIFNFSNRSTTSFALIKTLVRFKQRYIISV